MEYTRTRILLLPGMTGRTRSTLHYVPGINKYGYS